MASSFTVVVDRLEGAMAVLRTSDGQELVVDLSLLPPGTKEGSHININFALDNASAQVGRRKVRNLLSSFIKK